MDFITYIEAAFTPFNLAVSLGGLIIGIILGALPGLSSTFSCAVMLPVSFAMSPVSGLIFLGAVYMGSTYGGSFAAILIKTPGTPQSITTTFDGFPMTKKGLGGLALAIACVSSVVGGIVGIFVFLFFAPPLAKFALLFGPAEYFWLALFGLTIIASLSEGNLIKGLISGFFGLALSQIGVSVVSGDMRFTFESTALIGGIPIIPATIGLLCMPVAIDMIATSEKHLDTPKVLSKNQLAEAVKAVFSRKKNLFKSSLIGALIGIIPAAGGAIASLVAYAEAKRGARPEDAFGKGDPGGIVASESANNATVGSGLVPTFVLGIPGTPPDAVILGAMMVHGVQIGPKLFSDHSGVIYTFLAGITIATLLMLPVGLLVGKYIYRAVVNVPKSYLIPMIALMLLIGAFAIQNSHDDILIMLTLGVVAWTIGWFGFPAPPIVLGLLLGPIAEQGFAQSLMIGQAKGSVFNVFFSSPVSLILITLIVVAIALPPILKQYSVRFFIESKKVGEQV